MHLQGIQTKLRQGERCVMTAVGDSLTYGWMVSRGYLDFLRELLTRDCPGAHLRIHNCGLPGDTARGGLQRLPAALIGRSVDLLLVQFGLNDAFCGCPVADYGTSIREIIATARNHTVAEILLLTSTLPLDEIDRQQALRYYAELERVGHLCRIPVAAVHRAWQQALDHGTDHRSLVQQDRIHPTEAGYRLMARAIADVLLSDC